ncbi:hypothetical protein DEU42_106153 [Flavobacterium sp. AG291]|nr:hypothetical protein DEU42_106153 [Flavobacterium sp. AG291]
MSLIIGSNWLINGNLQLIYIITGKGTFDNYDKNVISYLFPRFL